MELVTIVVGAFLVLPLIVARTATYWKLYNTGMEALALAIERMIRALPNGSLAKLFPAARPKLIVDNRGAANILALVVTLIAAGLALKLGIGMMAEADNTITPPDQNNTEAYEAYQKTTTTIWKSFQMSPMALYATVFGVVIGAIVTGFGSIIFSRGGGGV
ncbi:hypothetical protein [Geoglobus ahangari]